MSVAVDSSALSFYIHIPYCIKRCGYCDFNTYTPAELKAESTLSDVSQGYIDLLIKEIVRVFMIQQGIVHQPALFGNDVAVEHRPDGDQEGDDNDQV